MADSSVINVIIPSETARGYEVQEQILALMELHHYPDKDLFGVKLALEEAIVNAIKHGNGLDPEKTVHIIVHVSDKQIEISIEDQGEGFVPEEVPDPTDDDNLDKPSGRGLMLMRAFMTSVEYNDRGNRVQMLKTRTTDE